MSKFIRLNVRHYSGVTKEWSCSEELINVDSIIRVFKENEKRAVIVTTKINGNASKYYTIDMPYEELIQYIINSTIK